MDEVLLLQLDMAVVLVLLLQLDKAVVQVQVQDIAVPALELVHSPLAGYNYDNIT